MIKSSHNNNIISSFDVTFDLALSSVTISARSEDKKNDSYAETLPRRQTILYVRLDDSPGRAAAS